MKRLKVDTDISELLSAFEADKEATLREIYTLYRPSFLAFGSQMTNDQELMIDCFQETIIGLYENLITGRVTDQKSTIKTYLFAIGKNKILNATKKSKNYNLHILAQADKESLKDENEQLSYQKILIAKAFDKLGERCQKILTRFYYDRYSIEAIMIDMSYKNINTVKAHKSRCIKNMKNIIATLKSVNT